MTQALHAILTQTRHVLLNLDGPVCDLFAGSSRALAADQLRTLFGGEEIEIPRPVADTTDPYEVMSFAATIGTDLAVRIASKLTDLETTAAMTAVPAPYLPEVLTDCHTSGRSAAIVTITSASAVNAYLAAHGLSDTIGVLSARADNDSAPLSSGQLQHAINALSAAPAAYALITSSPTQIECARLAGLHTIGYANRPGKSDSLTTAGADAIVTSLAHLSLELRARPLPS